MLAIMAIFVQTHHMCVDMPHNNNDINIETNISFNAYIVNGHKELDVRLHLQNNNCMND